MPDRIIFPLWLAFLEVTIVISLLLYFAYLQGLKVLIIFHIIIGHSLTICKVSHQVFCHFFLTGLSIFLLFIHRNMYIFWILIFFQSIYSEYVLQCMDYLLSCLLVRKSYQCWWNIIFIFAFSINASYILSNNFLPTKCVKFIIHSSNIICSFLHDWKIIDIGLCRTK